MRVMEQARASSYLSLTARTAAPVPPRQLGWYFLWSFSAAAMAQFFSVCIFLHMRNFMHLAMGPNILEMGQLSRTDWGMASATLAQSHQDWLILVVQTESDRCSAALRSFICHTPFFRKSSWILYWSSMTPMPFMKQVRLLTLAVHISFNVEASM